MEEHRTQAFEEVKEPYVELIHRQNLAILDKMKVGIPHNMLQRDVNEFPKDITKDESPNSDEDIWVDVKLSNSLWLASSYEAVTASCLEIVNDIEGAMNKKLEISVNEYHWKIKYLKDKNGHEHPTSNIYFHLNSLEENIGTISTSECSKENKQVEKARQEDNPIPPSFANNLRPKKTFYKEKNEIANAKSCMYMTILRISCHLLKTNILLKLKKSISIPPLLQQSWKKWNT